MGLFKKDIDFYRTVYFNKQFDEEYNDVCMEGLSNDHWHTNNIHTINKYLL